MQMRIFRPNSYGSTEFHAGFKTDGGDVLSWFYNQPGSTYVNDARPAQQPSIRIPKGLTPPGWAGAPITWVTYEDESSIAAKAEYVEANNLGGAIIWTLNEAATDPLYLGKYKGCRCAAVSGAFQHNFSPTGNSLHRKVSPDQCRDRRPATWLSTKAKDRRCDPF